MNNTRPDILSLAGKGSLLLLTKISSIDDLMARATESDRIAIEGFTAPSRRAERLAWRIMVREELERDIRIDYTEHGIPRITDRQFTHISVSHCADMVMVALAQHPCAVDIERTDRNFAKIVSRYISADELSFAGSNEAMAAVWCAKECLYKLAEERGLDLLHDIRIVAIDPVEATISGRVKDGECIEMQILRPDEEHIAVYHI